ncbi:MAG: glycosyltransferase family 2 protein [Halobacteriovoraceae bacterium]|nr:glycosyltransferase family 2 protein [Halobacteriovoraceae bacterium]
MLILSIVIPVYNGEQSIAGLVDELFVHLNEQVKLEIILVNDCSPDRSWQEIEKVSKKYPQQVLAINLSKNFGEHNAVMAGYNHSSGDYIVNIDDDFQNPPSEILKLLKELNTGHEVVYSKYSKKKHHFFRNWGSWFTNAMATIMLGKPKGLYLSSFRIISKQLKDEIIRYAGPFPYIDGLILRSTNKIGTIEVEHHDRNVGQSNYTIVKLIRLWSYMFLNFSAYPLRMASILGMVFAGIGFLGAAAVFIEKLLYPSTQIGWTSLIMTVFVLSGTQLVVLGVIGEYIGRLFITQSNRPQYVIHQKIGSHASNN